MYATFYFFSRNLDDLIVLNTHLGMYAGRAQALQLSWCTPELDSYVDHTLSPDTFLTINKEQL